MNIPGIGGVLRDAAAAVIKETPTDLTDLNPASLEVLTGRKVEPSLGNVAPGDRCQFERLGYFCADPDSRPRKLVFNRTVALKDAWAKIEKRSK